MHKRLYFEATNAEEKRRSASEMARCLMAADRAEEAQVWLDRALTITGDPLPLRPECELRGPVPGMKGYYWSTPTLFVDRGGEVGKIVRVNNYFISPDGCYNWSFDHSDCQNICFTAEGLRLLPRRADEVLIREGRATRGLEDVRALRHGGRLFFTATTEDMAKDEGQRRVAFGVFDGCALQVTAVMESPLGETVEKNWALFSRGDQIACVYRWCPLEVGEVRDGRLVDLRAVETAMPCFRQMRGSTHGQSHAGATWFITHTVEDIGGVRHYAHYLVGLHPVSCRVLGVGGPFRFTDGPIEFCTGFLILNGRVYVGFSHLDSTAQVSSAEFHDFLLMTGFRCNNHHNRAGDRSRCVGGCMPCHIGCIAP